MFGYVDRRAEPGNLVIGQCIQHMPTRPPHISVEVALVLQFAGSVGSGVHPSSQQFSPLSRARLIQVGTHGLNGLGK